MEGRARQTAIMRLVTRGRESTSPARLPTRPALDQREVVRRLLDAHNRRDLETMRALSDPCVQLDWSASRGPLAGVYRGIDAVIGFHRDWFSTFEEIVIEPERVVVHGQSLLVPNVTVLRGRGGIEVVARSTLEFTCHGRRVIGVRLVQQEHLGRAAA